MWTRRASVSWGDNENTRGRRLLVGLMVEPDRETRITMAAFGRST